MAEAYHDLTGVHTPDLIAELQRRGFTVTETSRCADPATTGVTQGFVERKTGGWDESYRPHDDAGKPK